MSGTKKIALVTGASEGIGFEVALQLGQKNIKVLIGARNEAKARVAVDQLKAENIEAEFVSLNIVDTDSISEAKKYIEKQYGKLDILVNNAGISSGEEQLPSKIKEVVLDTVLRTNFFAQVTVTQIFLPLVKSTNGCIVNVSSSLGSLSMQSNANYKYFPFNNFGYNVSKTALNAFTVALAKELQMEGSSVKINSADPDWCRTKLGGDIAPFSPKEGAQIIVKLATLEGNGPSGGFFNGNNLLAW
jgi:NAD(P)-dependent dehydrogenase (short-subunit alcohol dehydrogenase family)